MRQAQLPLSSQQSTPPHKGLKQRYLLLQIVLAVLGTWAIVIYGSMKTFGGKKEPAVPEAPAH